MTRRRDIEAHRQGLAEIGEIMNSMKTLAYMETRKLAHFIEAQQAVVSSIEEAAADFLHFYPEMLPAPGDATPVYLLIGAERGFCGDFAHPLVDALEQALLTRPAQQPVIIAIGRKLHALLNGNPRVTAMLDGAGVVEDIPLLLDGVLDLLLELQQQHHLLSLHCIYHRGDEELVTERLLPPFEKLARVETPFAHAPCLNLAPEAFLIELADQHLLAALQAILYTSLMAENHRRVMHLEGAVRHLDEQSAELERQGNILRQEEITEEIEVLLLSAASLEAEHGKHTESNGFTEARNSD